MKSQILQIGREVTMYFLCHYCLLPHFQIKLQCHSVEKKFPYQSFYAAEGRSSRFESGAE